jgi:hypothetical protein
MRRLLAAVAATALLSAPAAAQFNMGGGGDSKSKTRYTEEEKRKEAEVEKAYRETVKNTKSATTEAYDPWRNIRPADEKKR